MVHRSELRGAQQAEDVGDSDEALRRSTKNYEELRRRTDVHQSAGRCASICLHLTRQTIASAGQTTLRLTEPLTSANRCSWDLSLGLMKLLQLHVINGNEASVSRDVLGVHKVWHLNRGI